MAEHSLLNTRFPVGLPNVPELHLSKADFDRYIWSLVTSTTLPIRRKDEYVEAGEDMEQEAVLAAPSERVEDDGDNQSPFMKGLLSDKAIVPSFDDCDGKMLTENGDVAYGTSGQALVDLFYELEDVISAARMKTTLENAWQVDPEATLKIIWNARSIHLGKSSRNAFYRAVGWLAQNHPLTLVANLPWLVRPLIKKKALKRDEKESESKDIDMLDAEDADSDFEIIETKGEELERHLEQENIKLDNDDTEFDVKFGVSHGYWKDLLNILALAANDQLKVDGDPKNILNISKPEEKLWERDWTEGKKKSVYEERHARTVAKFATDDLYKALHLTVARLFADQLKTDLTRLQSGQKAETKRITLAAKWAPTHKGMHDQYTTIVSTIAELLHPFDKVCPDGVNPADRETYLKYARIAYQSQVLSPLRKHLNIVERDITAKIFSEIKYERVPSVAMARYTPLFAKKDFDHFDSYIERVASGKSKISGATLLPSTLVRAVTGHNPPFIRGQKGADAMVQSKLRDIQMRTINAQWNTLVQRIKDSGTLQSSIAVCDVSGSMTSPSFSDGTCPMDSAVGLSLLLAEVTKPPFGGAFITFSHRPQVMRVGGLDDKRSFQQKVKYIQDSNWSMNTDFAAVFEKLILPMAIENKIRQEDMVKQVFVFSDMQFDSAGGGRRWTTSFERIKKQFEEAGYEMPMLIFWNLAGGRAGYGQNHLNEDDAREDAAPKPVTAAEEGTALVSGYSQGQLKMFLDNGTFEDPKDNEEEEQVEEQEGEDGEVIIQKKEKQKKDPLDIVRKAISHEAYRLLKVVD